MVDVFSGVCSLFVNLFVYTITNFFAHDVKVCLEISTVDDTIEVETALDLMSIWASEWQLQLSISNCNMLDIGHVPHDTTHTYTVDGSVLPCSVKCRDLAICLHHNTYMQSLPKHINVLTVSIDVFVW